MDGTRQIIPWSGAPVSPPSPPLQGEQRTGIREDRQPVSEEGRNRRGKHLRGQFRKAFVGGNSTTRTEESLFGVPPVLGIETGRRAFC